jgi:hypothetical protein
MRARNAAPLPSLILLSAVNLSSGGWQCQANNESVWIRSVPSVDANVVRESPSKNPPDTG